METFTILSADFYKCSRCGSNEVGAAPMQIKVNDENPRYPMGVWNFCTPCLIDVMMGGRNEEKAEEAKDADA